MHLETNTEEDVKGFEAALSRLNPTPTYCLSNQIKSHLFVSVASIARFHSAYR